MKKIISALTAIAAFTGLLVFGSGHSVAAVNNSNQNDYEVQPILPDSQVDMSKNYWDLQAKKDSTQVIQLRIQNFTKKHIKVSTSLRNAYTQVGGGIDFQHSQQGLDRSLKIPFTKLAKLNFKARTIALGPNQTKILSATITYPKKMFRGLIYGDWHFIEHVKRNANDRTAIKANYAYSIGVMLRGNHWDKTGPNMKYDQTTPFLYNKHPALGIDIRNTQPMALTKMAVLAQVMRKGDNNSLKEYSANDLTVAPNSMMRLPITWNYDTMKPGVYLIKVTIRGNNVTNNFPIQWKFRREFRVAKHTADKINSKAAKQPANKWLYAAVGTGLVWIISAAGLAWLFIVRPK